MSSRPSGLVRMLAPGLLVVTIVSVPLLTFGVFEGFYNHLPPAVLFLFGGASRRRYVFVSPWLER